MLPHLLEILLVGQEAIQLYYLPVQMILIFNGSPLVFNNGEPWVHKALLPFQFHLLLPFTQQLVLSELLREISALIRKIGLKPHCHTPQAITLL